LGFFPGHAKIVVARAYAQRRPEESRFPICRGRGTQPQKWSKAACQALSRLDRETHGHTPTSAQPVRCGDGDASLGGAALSAKGVESRGHLATFLRFMALSVTVTRLSRHPGLLGNRS
jgi:hypothetical protein